MPDGSRSASRGPRSPLGALPVHPGPRMERGHRRGRGEGEGLEQSAIASCARGQSSGAGCAAAAGPGIRTSARTTTSSGSRGAADTASSWSRPNAWCTGCPGTWRSRPASSSNPGQSCSGRSSAAAWLQGRAWESSASARSGRSRSFWRGSRARVGSSPTGSARRSWSLRFASAQTRPSTSRSVTPPLGEHDLVIETAGAVRLSSSRPGSCARAAASCYSVSPARGAMLASLPADRIPLRDLELIGSVGYTSAAWGRLVALLADRSVDLAPIVTHRFPLEEFEASLRAAGEPRRHRRQDRPRARPAALTLSTCSPPGALSRPAPDLRVARKS